MSRQLSEAMKEMKSRMNVDLELRDKSQKELEGDLTSAKHNLLEVRHQLNMAEKVRIILNGNANYQNSHFLYSGLPIAIGSDNQVILAGTGRLKIKFFLIFDTRLTSLSSWHVKPMRSMNFVPYEVFPILYFIYNVSLCHNAGARKEVQPDGSL